MDPQRRFCHTSESTQATRTTTEVVAGDCSSCLTACPRLKGVLPFYDPAANNRGFDSRYWYLNPEVTFVRFVWERDFKRLRVFNRTPGEENGRYLTDAEKVQVIAANNIPAQPE